MPTISMFFGIIIRMYFAPKEHNPAHIHAYYQDNKATFKIHDGELIDGQFHYQTSSSHSSLDRNS